MFELIKKYRVWLLFICGTMLYFAANLQRVAIPGAVFNELQTKWGLSASQVTGFGASFMYVYAFAQLFVGLLCDRYGGARVMFSGGILFVLGGFLFALVDNYFLLCLGRALTGFGASAFYLGLVSEAIRYFKRNYSLVISLIVMTGYAGGIVANAPFSFAVGCWGLRETLIIAGVFSLLFYLLYLIPFKCVRKPSVCYDVKFSGKNFLAVIKIRNNWNIFLFSGVNWGLYYSIQTVIGKKYLEDFCGISTGTAALVLSTTSVISAVAGFVYAITSKKLGDRRKPLCLLTGSMCFFVFLMLTILTASGCRNFIPAILMCCLASTSSLSAIVIPLIKESNSAKETGSAIAFSNFGAYILVAVFGNVIGGIMNLFPPEKIGGKLIYSQYAYVSVFAFMFLCACGVLFWVIKLKEQR
ncbi:MAG: MFS transporter [Lentisphaerae bacterium]|nr:MFS transporter [Lentisphaerota bacterium]